MSYSLHVITPTLQFIDKLIDECQHIINDVTLNLPGNSIDVTLASAIACSVFELRALQLDVDIIHIGEFSYAIPTGAD